LRYDVDRVVVHGRRCARVSAVARSRRARAGLSQQADRLLIGYSPGGSAEAGARPLARVLEPLSGSRSSSNTARQRGGVAMESMRQAPTDGYTLYYFDSGPLTVAPHLPKVGYDKLSSFTHLGHVCGSGSLLVVHPSTPFKSVPT
jgi:tripartite-type tricarboxylate transporter receptor subunit TctC